MIERSPESILLESDYMRLMLEDLLEINDTLPKVSEALLPAQGATFALSLASGETAMANDIIQYINQALQVVSDAQEPLLRIVELIGGRAQAIQLEAEED